MGMPLLPGATVYETSPTPWVMVPSSVLIGGLNFTVVVVTTHPGIAAGLTEAIGSCTGNLMSSFVVVAASCSLGTRNVRIASSAPLVESSAATVTWALAGPASASRLMTPTAAAAPARRVRVVRRADMGRLLKAVGG